MNRYIKIFLTLAVTVQFGEQAKALDGTSLQAQYIKDIDMANGSLSRGLDVLMQFFTPGVREARTFLKDVRHIRMAVYETEHLSNPTGELDLLLDDLESEGWDRAVQVREKDEHVWIMFRETDDSARDIYVVSINPDVLIEVKDERRPDRMIAGVMERSSRRRYWDDDDDDGIQRRNRSKNRERSRRKKYVDLSTRYPDGYDEVHLRYNRVDGAYVGIREQGEFRGRFGLTPFGEAGYAFNSERWQFQVGGDLYRFLGGHHLLSSGFEYHDRTDTQDGWLVGETENSIAGALFREDNRDYYRRKGWSIHGTYNIHNYVQLTSRYVQDRFSSLPNTVNWSLFENRFANDTFRLNPAIDAGRIRSVQTVLHVDSSTKRWRDRRRGWQVTGMIERAGGALGGDFDFDRYQIGVRRYQPIGRDMRLDLRIRLGSSDGVLPSQYLYDLGGISTLRGYGYKAFTGDRMMLFNAEYWFDERMWHNEWPLEMFDIGAFFDAGAVWFSQPPAITAAQTGSGGIQLTRNIRSSAGLAFKIAGIRAYFARPLGIANKDWQVSVRVNRTF